MARAGWVYVGMLLVTLACSPSLGTRPEPAPNLQTGELPASPIDPACGRVVGSSFRTVRSQPLGVAGNVPVVGPWVISFLTDGRVVWKYSQTAVIGEYRCLDGDIQAVFSTGDRESLRGKFDLEMERLMLDDMEYVRIVDE